MWLWPRVEAKTRADETARQGVQARKEKAEQQPTPRGRPGAKGSETFGELSNRNG
jgi:hypothetical protein